MQTKTFGSNYSGIGPSNFNKRQLYEIIKMRKKAGKKTRRAFSVSKLEETSRQLLVKEAKRVRVPDPWSSYYFNEKIKKYGKHLDFYS